MPSGSWVQCGATIAAYGSSGSPASPATINNAIAGTGSGYTGCATPYVILLGSGDFYLNANISLRSNVVLRGGGANQTRLHFSSGGTYACGAVTCIVGSNSYGGTCSATQWPCPPGSFTPNGGNANWMGGYSQGATTITLDSVSGITPNLTPIVLDQCDTGFAGASGVGGCNAVAGAITAANVYAGAGGSGYAVGDTGTINPVVTWGMGYGSGAATYRVTSVSGGAVTGFIITNGGGGYTYSNVGFTGVATTTTRTSGSGSGFGVQITAITPYDTGTIFPCGISIVCANLSSANTSRRARSQQEVVVATAISGTGPYTLTLSRPLIHPNWSAGQGPQAWWGTATITNAGIENLELDMSAVSSGAQGVMIQTGYKIWVSGIASNTANVFHVSGYMSSNILVRDSYFYYTLYQGTTSYGLGSSGALGAALFENNIIQGVVAPLVPDGPCTGCVFDYNFSVNDADGSTSAMFASSSMHSSSTDYILEEGNIGAGAFLDDSHGPHFLNTFYRNYYKGYEANEGQAPYQSTIPIIIGAFSRYNNVVANVLGTPGYHTVYQCVAPSSSQQYCPQDAGAYPGGVHIFDIGYSAVGQRDFSNSPYEPNDTITGSSLLRWGNWDNVTAATRWCGSSSDTGWSTTCGSTSEVPTADPNFPVSIPNMGDIAAGQQALPASFIYPSEPSWWPTGKAWPAIGPDITTGNIGQCSGGSYPLSKAISATSCTAGSFTSPTATNGSHAISIPAMDCYFTMGGLADGTGSFLSFNAGSCYAVQSGSPVPPHNLTAIAH